MEQLIEFAGNHPFLMTGLVVVSGLLTWNLLGGVISGVENLGPMAATQLINHQDALVLDVREDSEFSEGHIINALHIPLGSLGGRIAQLEKHREQPIVISCRSGNRSASACRMLKKKGFEKVYNLQGGILAWQNANLPVVTGRKR